MTALYSWPPWLPSITSWFVRITGVTFYILSWTLFLIVVIVLPTAFLLIGRENGAAEWWRLWINPAVTITVILVAVDLVYGFHLSIPKFWKGTSAELIFVSSKKKNKTKTE